MVNFAHILLILAVAVDIDAQFYDFFSAFKPPTLRPIFEPTKPPRLRTYATTERYQENGRIKAVEHTTKYIRKTTKTSKQSNKKSKIDNIIDDGRNTINYENPRIKTYTENPFARPGVKPAVVNGPPITNKPPPKPYIPRPIAGLGQMDDSSVTPELIIGPDEDYMSSVEKQRYIEMAEKKCEQYMSLNTVRVEAIPLVPSPSPVVVNVSTCAWSVPLVVGGNTVTIQQFPHMALLGWARVQSGGYSWKCGGSLISERHVLTAAHCAYQERDDTVSIGPPRAVQLGSSQLDDPGAIVQRVSSVTRHPKYRPPQSYHDIAVVTMTSAVTFSSAIRPACIGAPPAPGEHFIATGWGKTEFGGEQSSELRGVSLTVWSRADCAAALENTRKLPRGPDESQTCAGERDGGKDTCQGDSGGPAQVQSRCSWRVLAVTSAGRSCGAPGTPALYANIPLAFVAKVAYERLAHDEKPNSNNIQNTNSSRRINDYNQQNSNNRGNNYNRPNSNNRENNYNQQSSNNRENNYNGQNSHNRENDYDGPKSNNRENNYNQHSSNNRENDYNGQNSHNRENDYDRERNSNRENNNNRQNSNNRENDYNRQNNNNRENDYNRQNSNNRDNDYTQQSSHNRGNDYNRQNSNNRDNDYNRQNSNNRENDYTQQSSYNRGNDYNRQNSNNRENDYTQQSSYNRGNDYNRQHSNNRDNDYNRQNSNNQQNEYNQNSNSNNQQSQWNKRTTTTPRRNQNQQSYNDGWNNNYNNPPYIESSDGRYRRTEHTTFRPHYYYPSQDLPYSDGIVWRT